MNKEELEEVGRIIEGKEKKEPLNLREELLKDNNGLLPCPYCGHTPIIEKDGSSGTLKWIIRCECGANNGYRHIEETVIRAWNNRV